MTKAVSSIAGAEGSVSCLCNCIVCAQVLHGQDPWPWLSFAALLACDP